jgi:hypothetical protein
MTPDERAEKIVEQSFPKQGGPWFTKETVIKFIASEIRAAVEESKKDGAFTAKQMDAAINKAWAAAYEDAAKIADDWGAIGSHSLARECGRQVAETIRARAAEVGK